MEKVDQIDSPPVIGKFYMVSHVTAEIHSRKFDIPVLGDMHVDSDLIKDLEHFHIDDRFKVGCEYLWNDDFTRSNGILHNSATIEINTSIFYKKRKCIRRWTGVNYKGRSNIEVSAKAQSFYNKHFNKGHNIQKTNMKCPHRGFDLRSCPVVDGKIECPLHGLVFSAKTGNILSLKEALKTQKQLV